MDAGLQLLAIGVLLAASLLMRSVAAKHVPPDTVPICLQARLRLRNQLTPAMLAMSTVLILSGLVIFIGSQIATSA